MFEIEAEEEKMVCLELEGRQKDGLSVFYEIR